jgi:hypothetical protein
MGPHSSDGFSLVLAGLPRSAVARRPLRLRWLHDVGPLAFGRGHRRRKRRRGGRRAPRSVVRAVHLVRAGGRPVGLRLRRSHVCRVRRGRRGRAVAALQSGAPFLRLLRRGSHQRLPVSRRIPRRGGGAHVGLPWRGPCVPIAVKAWCTSSSRSEDEHRVRVGARPRPRCVYERERGGARKRIQAVTRTSVPMTRFIWAGRAGGMAAM